MPALDDGGVVDVVGPHDGRVEGGEIQHHHRAAPLLLFLRALGRHRPRVEAAGGRKHHRANVGFLVAVAHVGDHVHLVVGVVQQLVPAEHLLPADRLSEHGLGRPRQLDHLAEDLLGVHEVLQKLAVHRAVLRDRPQLRGVPAREHVEHLLVVHVQLSPAEDRLADELQLVRLHLLLLLEAPQQVQVDHQRDPHPAPPRVRLVLVGGVHPVEGLVGPAPHLEKGLHPLVVPATAEVAKRLLHLRGGAVLAENVQLVRRVWQRLGLLRGGEPPGEPIPVQPPASVRVRDGGCLQVNRPQLLAQGVLPFLVLLFLQRVEGGGRARAQGLVGLGEPAHFLPAPDDAALVQVRLLAKIAERHGAVVQIGPVEPLAVEGHHHVAAGHHSSELADQLGLVLEPTDLAGRRGLRLAETQDQVLLQQIPRPVLEPGFVRVHQHDARADVEHHVAGHGGARKRAVRGVGLDVEEADAQTGRGVPVQRGHVRDVRADLRVAVPRAPDRGNPKSFHPHPAAGQQVVLDLKQRVGREAVVVIHEGRAGQAGFLLLIVSEVLKQIVLGNLLYVRLRPDRPRELPPPDEVAHLEAEVARLHGVARLGVGHVAEHGAPRFHGHLLHPLPFFGLLLGQDRIGKHLGMELGPADRATPVERQRAAFHVHGMCLPLFFQEQSHNERTSLVLPHKPALQQAFHRRAPFFLFFRRPNFA